MESTVQESRAFIDLCYKMQEYFPDESRRLKVLRKLAIQAEHFSQKFTANGLFDINKKLVFSFIGTVMTNLIIIMQFNSANLIQSNINRN